MQLSGYDTTRPTAREVISIILLPSEVVSVDELEQTFCDSSAIHPCSSAKSVVNTAIQFSRAQRSAIKRSRHDHTAMQRMRFFDALNPSHANDQDQPVAAADFAMCAQPIGNSAASFGSPLTLVRHLLFRLSMTVDAPDRLTSMRKTHTHTSLQHHSSCVEVGCTGERLQSPGWRE
jgi:hypothetical protein